MSETPKPFGASLIIKRTVAVTGLIMLAFVAFHLTNNIQIYFGQETYNRDGFAWKTPLVITKVRPVLIVAVTVHVIGAVWVTLLNKRSRAGA
jgi:succinate dehydrogenase/fumarate reductase cytochrome b subunit